MAKKTQKTKIACRHFVWLLGQRNGVYVADGRSNQVKLGRHSLGTRDRADAIQQLTDLDTVMAVRHGLADVTELQNSDAEALPLADGAAIYLKHAARPVVLGGARASSVKRYRAVLAKFVAFALANGWRTWNEVTAQLLRDYAGSLADYEYATQYFELTTLKQVVKWFVDEGKLPESARIRLPLKKPQGTSTYCWTPAEVTLILDFCRSKHDLEWLADVLQMLAATGLRISELADLTWSNIGPDYRMIHLYDDSTRGRHSSSPARRQTTKGKRDRSLPIHDDLRGILEAMPRKRDGYVFHGPRGGRLDDSVVRQTLVTQVLKPLAREHSDTLGERFTEGTTHSFRHYFCSVAANQGLPQRALMRWLGHRASAMVEHYYHLHDDESQRQMQRLKFVIPSGEQKLADDT